MKSPHDTEVFVGQACTTSGASKQKFYLFFTKIANPCSVILYF
jgi:hypothetical protein